MFDLLWKTRVLFSNSGRQKFAPLSKLENFKVL